MKIAYFTNQYPNVSHSFIRREIKAMEKLDLSLERFAVRVDLNELVDPQDLSEFERTRYLLHASVLKMVAATIRPMLMQPINFLSVLWSTIKLGRRSDRGILRHLIYLVEACLLKKWLNDSVIDHVHVHFGTNSTMVAMLCHQLGGPPYSFTVHGPEEFDKPEFISLGEKIQRSSFTVAISSYGRSQLYRWVDSIYWEKIHIVHCGLETSFHCDAPLAQYGSDNIVCVGRLCEQKGQLLLIESLSYLVKQGLSIHLTLAGDGPMRSEVEEFVEQHQLEQYVTITGWLSSEQVRDEILNARALVLPSFAEGLPVVIMEAMALGCPVLSTYVAGIPELITPKENGWLVPAGDKDALAKAMKDILDRPREELQRMGINAKKRVLSRHSIDTEAGKILDLFKASIEGCLG